jgi:putative flippase GtrA
VLRSALSAVAANALALLVTAVANTAANRRFTFGVTGRHRRLRQHLEGLVVFGLGLAMTTGALGLLERTTDHPGRAAELAALVAANAAATVARFVLLRSWVFHPHRTSPFPRRGSLGLQAGEERRFLPSLSQLDTRLNT